MVILWLQQHLIFLEDTSIDISLNFLWVLISLIFVCESDSFNNNWLRMHMILKLMFNFRCLTYITSYNLHLLNSNHSQSNFNKVVCCSH